VQTFINVINADEITNVIIIIIIIIIISFLWTMQSYSTSPRTLHRWNSDGQSCHSADLYSRWRRFTVGPQSRAY